MFRRITIYLLFLCLYGTYSHAQLQLGVGAGLALYTGEIETYRFSDGLYFNFKPGLDAYIRYHGEGAFAIQGGVWVGSLAADDRDAVASGRQIRGLRFNSILQQARLQIEWYPIRHLRKTPGRVEIYGSLGISAFRFNPTTDFQGQTFELQPLGTEGQFLDPSDNNRPYDRITWAIPAGGGLRVWISEDFYLNLQALYHYTQTDYIDDVSGAYPDLGLLTEINPRAAELSWRRDEIDGQLLPTADDLRGNPGVNDAFITGSVSLVFLLHSSGRAIGCPRF